MNARDDLDHAAWLDRESERARDYVDTSPRVRADTSPTAARILASIAAVNTVDLVVDVDAARAAWLHNTDPELEALIIALVVTDRVDWTGRRRPERLLDLDPLHKPPTGPPPRVPAQARKAQP